MTCQVKIKNLEEMPPQVLDRVHEVRQSDSVDIIDFNETRRNNYAYEYYLITIRERQWEPWCYSWKENYSKG